MIESIWARSPSYNNVPTFQCRKQEDLDYTLAHLSELVVKEVHGAGGYGMLVGPAATKAEIEEFRQVLLAKPDGYISQPTLSLSSCPTYVESGIAPAPHRFASLRVERQDRANGARRPDPRGAERRLTGGELVPRRRHQRHMDS